MTAFFEAHWFELYVGVLTLFPILVPILVRVICGGYSN